MVLWGLVSVSACAPGRESVSGEISLHPDVDVRDYAVLHIEVVYTVGDEIVLARSERLEDIELPFEYTLAAERLDGDTVFAWLSTKDDAAWPSPDDPRGRAEFVLCECDSHALAYADDIDVRIDP